MEPDVDMHSGGSDHLKDWVTSENTPAYMHNTMGMTGEDRSYTYAQDEIERSLLQMAPEAMGTCKIELKASSFLDVSVAEETRRFHHTNKHKGQVARAYGDMLARAFNKTKSAHKHLGKSASGTIDKERFFEALRLAQEEECRSMASKCNGDYKREYNCKADQPRFFLPWMGSKTWHETMTDDELKHAVLQDPCCSGDEDSLIPGAVSG